MALHATGPIVTKPQTPESKFDATHAANLIVKTEKPDWAAFFAYLQSIDALNDPAALQFLEDEGLSGEYQMFLGAQTAEPSELETYLETADPRDPKFFSTIADAGFDALKIIEYRRPDLIVKVQATLETTGEYVNDKTHRFYRDGKIGREETSVTWEGIQSAAGLTVPEEKIQAAATAEYLSEIEQLKLQIALNTNSGENGPVGNTISENQANALMAEADPQSIGRGLTRLLHTTIPEGLAGWAGANTQAATHLQYIKEHPFEPGKFDPEKFGSRDEATYMAMREAAVYHTGLTIGGYRAEDFGLKALGAMAYIESNYGHHRSTYKDNAMPGSSASGIMQQTKTYAWDRYKSFGSQMSSGSMLGKGEVFALRNDDRFASELTLLENMSNIKSLKPAMREMARFASGVPDETRLIAHSYMEHNVGKGGHDMIMAALRDNPNQSMASYMSARGHSILHKNNPSLYYRDDRALSAAEVYQNYVAKISRGLEYHTAVAEKFDPADPAPAMASNDKPLTTAFDEATPRPAPETQTAETKPAPAASMNIS